MGINEQQLASLRRATRDLAARLAAAQIPRQPPSPDQQQQLEAAAAAEAVSAASRAAQEDAELEEAIRLSLLMLDVPKETRSDKVTRDRPTSGEAEQLGACAPSSGEVKMAVNERVPEGPISASLVRRAVEQAIGDEDGDGSNAQERRRSLAASETTKVEVSDVSRKDESPEVGSTLSICIIFTRLTWADLLHC